MSVQQDAPMVTRRGLCDMQVCVPKEWTDSQAESYANQENPTGICSQWQIRHAGDEALSGCEERVQCEERDGCIHIMLSC